MPVTRSKNNMNIDQDKIPSTMDEAVDQLIQSFTEDEKDLLRKTSPSHYHFTLGMYLRNNWSFWEDTPLRRDAIKRWKIAHADDLSGLLFEWVFAKLKNESCDPNIMVQRYHNHWKKYNTTSLEASNLDENGQPLNE